MPGLSRFSVELQQAGEMGFEALLLGNKEKQVSASGQGNILDFEPDSLSCGIWPKTRRSMLNFRCVNTTSIQKRP